jgi:hypothetical protein
MTEPKSSTMREDRESEKERLAAEAFDRICKSNHWRDWTYLAAGFELGRMHAMRVARTNEPLGRAYNTAFSNWMDDPARRTWTRGIDQATRNHLLWVADNLPSIEAWRETLAANQRDRLNHPTVVKRTYEAAHRAAKAREQGEPVMTPMEALKAALVESQEDAARWKRQAEENGSLFDVRRDTPEQIARALVDAITPSGAEKIAAAIRAELKRQKQAHAG